MTTFGKSKFDARLAASARHTQHGNFSAPHPALSSFGEERENYFVGRLTQGGALLVPGYFLSGFPPFIGLRRDKSALFNSREFV
jgi:hypothetical protein